MSIFGKFKTYICTAVVLAIAISTVSCSSKTSEFPSLPSPVASETSEIIITESESADPVYYELTVALPYDEQTVNYLFKLFYAKNNGYWNESDTGLSVSLEYLDSLKTASSITALYVPEDGVSVDTIAQWGSDRPDVFLTNDYKGTIEKGYCAPLDDVLYDDPLFDAENIYVSSVAELMYNGNLYGVPHYCSVPLIFANKDFVGEDADFKCSISELDNLFEKVENEAPEGTVVFSKGYQLVPYITSANNAEEANSYMLKAEYKSNRSSSQSSLDKAVEYVGDLYDKGVFVNSNEDGSDPVLSRNCAMWITSSSDLTLWSDYFPGKLSLMQIPSFENSDETIAYVNLYPLCVSSSAENLDLASEFAAFISLDPDARLLINRLENKVGFLPLIRSERVWDELKTDESFGYVVSVYESAMDKAVYTPNIIDKNLYDSIEQRLIDCYNVDDGNYELNLVEIYEK